MVTDNLRDRVAAVSSDLYKEMQHRMDYNRDYEDGKPKHRLTAFKLDYTDVRYFDSYGYLLLYVQMHVHVYVRKSNGMCLS